MGLYRARQPRRALIDIISASRAQVVRCVATSRRQLTSMTARPSATPLSFLPPMRAKVCLSLMTGGIRGTLLEPRHAAARRLYRRCFIAWLRRLDDAATLTGIRERPLPPRSCRHSIGALARLIKNAATRRFRLHARVFRCRCGALFYRLLIKEVFAPH